MEDKAGDVPKDCAAEAIDGGPLGLADAADGASPEDAGDDPMAATCVGGPGGGPKGGGATCPLGIPDIDGGSLTALLKDLLETAVAAVAAVPLPLPTDVTERRGADPEVDEDLRSGVTRGCSESGAVLESMMRRPVAEAKLGVALRDGARRTPPELAENEVPGGCRRTGGVGGV